MNILLSQTFQTTTGDRTNRCPQNKKEKAIESCRMWKDTGRPKSGPIYTQYKKTNYYTKSAFAKSRLLRPVIVPMIYMKLYCANLVKNFGRFGNQSSPMLLPTLFRLMALRTALLQPLTLRNISNQFASQLKLIMRLLKPNIMPLEHITVDLF